MSFRNHNAVRVLGYALASLAVFHLTESAIVKRESETARPVFHDFLSSVHKAVFQKRTRAYLNAIFPPKRSRSLPSPGAGERDGNATEPVVFLTVSSAVSNQQDRLLEVNWDHIPDGLLGDGEDVWIYLYDKEPSSAQRSPLVAVKPDSKGHFRTSVRFPEQVFTSANLSDSCLGFWVALLRREQVVASSCLRAHPHWMHSNRQAIGNLMLTDIMIPGTHNAGTYAPFDPDDNSIFNRYVYTQEEDIWQQLVYGIRYVDLRVAYHHKSGAGSERFWITHSSFRTDTTLMDVVRQVKRFLAATKEIVFMDFHRFVTGFTNRRTSRQRHRELIALLEEELEEVMIPADFKNTATLNQLWEADRRLYVGYADERSRRQSRFLFPAVRQLWGDVDTVAGLKQFLGSKICDDGKGRLVSAMAQLTPKTRGVIFDTYGGLRNMTDQVNRHVSKWFQGDYWGHCTNVVATDFFLGNNVVELAIRENLMRSSRSH